MDKYKKTEQGWKLILPRKYKTKIFKRSFNAIPARTFGERGYFSKKVNGKVIRMWDFTEEQYKSLEKHQINYADKNGTTLLQKQ